MVIEAILRVRVKNPVAAQGSEPLGLVSRYGILHKFLSLPDRHHRTPTRETTSLPGFSNLRLGQRDFAAGRFEGNSLLHRRS